VGMSVPLYRCDRPDLGGTHPKRYGIVQDGVHPGISIHNEIHHTNGSWINACISEGLNEPKSAQG
jgi:hypothetical protein